MCIRDRRNTYGRGYAKLGAETNQFQWFLKEELAKASARAGQMCIRDSGQCDRDTQAGIR